MLSRLKEQTFVRGKRVTRQELPELPGDAATTVHRVKVSLYGAKPPVWRRLEIPSAMPLNLVHAVLQVAFDWRDYHVHAFETVCGEFGSPDLDDWAERRPGSTPGAAKPAAGSSRRSPTACSTRPNSRRRGGRPASPAALAPLTLTTTGDPDHHQAIALNFEPNGPCFVSRTTCGLAAGHALPAMPRLPRAYDGLSCRRTG
jgi:Plasmid pRiA4b ORF-3-like protein